MNSNLHKLYYNLGHVLHQQGDWGGAADCYRQVIALNPTYASAHHNLGAVLDAQGQRQAAIASYQRAISLQPNHINALNNLAGALLKQGQVEDAIQVYQQAIALQPDWALLHHHFGQALQACGDVDEAIAAYRRAIDLEPHRVAAHYALGKLLQQQQHFAAADTCFQTVLQLQPDHETAYGDRGACLLALGQFNDAMLSLHRAIALQPVFVDAFCQWADRLSASDELTQAKQACSRFLKTLRHTPNHPDLQTDLAQTYIHLGNVLITYGGIPQYKQAEAFYQKALQLCPHDVNLYLRLGTCLTRQTRWDAAIAIYHLALAKFPHHLTLHLKLGRVLEKQNRLPEAIGLYRETLRMREIGEIGEIGGAIAPSVGVFRTPIKIYRSTLEWINSCGINLKNYIAIPRLSPSPYGVQPTSIHPSPYLSPSPPSFPPPQSSSSPPPPPSPPPSPYSPLPYHPPPPQHPTPPTPHPTPCPGLNCSPCLQKILSSFKPVQCTPGVYTCTNQPSLSTEPWPTFVATVPNGRAWIAPQQNAWMVCNAIAILTEDNALLADVSRDYPGQLPGCQSHNPSQHRIFSQEELPPLKQVDGSIAVLAGLSGNTYYHWMIDILPRFELLRQSGINLTEIDWFLINNNQPGFQQETLDVLGIPPSKILQSDRYPHIQAKQLIVPSFPDHLGWTQPWILTFLRQEFLSRIRDENLLNYPSKIYISRANANYRRVLNESDVIEYLSRFGFVAIAPESLSFQAQVALFSQAKVIISPHGSGLTNTIFSQPGTKVIELVSPHYIRHYYWQISQQLQFDHYYLPGDVFSCYPIRELMYPNPLTEDLWVPINSLQRLMKLLQLTD